MLKNNKEILKAGMEKYIQGIQFGVLLTQLTVSDKLGMLVQDWQSWYGIIHFCERGYDVFADSPW